MIAALLGAFLDLPPARAALDGEDDLGACREVGTLFEEITATADIGGHGNSLGVSLNDLDGDGDFDILLAMGPSRATGALYLPGETQVYRNEGDGTFTEVGAAWGLDSLCEDRSPMVADLTGDGLLDVYVTVNGRNLLHLGTGDPEHPFVDHTAEGGQAGHVGWGHEGALLDYDRDGFLDVFFTNGPEDGSTPSTLLRNQGDGTFADVTEAAGVAGDPSGKGNCVLDANLDGWPDLFVTSGRGFPNHLWLNQGDGTFVDAAPAWGVDDPGLRFGVGMACGDLDDDGDPDVMVITHDHIHGGNLLYENLFADGEEGMREVAAEAGVAEWIDGHGIDFVDIDLDGRLDIVLAGLNTAPVLLLNAGGMRFERACNGAGVTIDSAITWGAVSGDLTGDGWPELFISQGLGRRPRDDALFLHLGPGDRLPDAHWLRVEAVGADGNTSAVGARVEVEVDGQLRTRWVGDWSSFDSQGPLPVTFGLGAADRADRVRVHFPDGSVVEETDVPTDQQVRVAAPAPYADADRDGVPDEWDTCPGTRPLLRTDPHGCAPEQAATFAVALLGPDQDAILDEPTAFTWETSEPVEGTAVLQFGLEGSFGPAGRVDWGPLPGGEAYSPTAGEWEALRALGNGSDPVLWRVVVSAEGHDVASEPRRLVVARREDLVRIPYGVNRFQPAHVSVEAGDPITWWNDGVEAGNLQNEPHDLLLLDPDGRVISDMHELLGSGAMTLTFDEPGLYAFICHRHTGQGDHTDRTMETDRLVHADGPFACMAGTVRVR